MFREIFLLYTSIIGLIIAAPFIDNVIDDTDDFYIDLTHLAKTIYGAPSNRTGDRVAKWTAESKVNPEELGEYAEGDIFQAKSLSRNGLTIQNSRWPGGIVPYMISPIFNSNQRKLIMQAINDFHTQTCVRFVPRTGEENYIRITAGYNGCYSTVGRAMGPQDVNLQIPGCVTLKGTVIHELMHAIGFFHEQSRNDRDDYVEILRRNIEPGSEANFEKTPVPTTAFGVRYDYSSVMHYGSTAFSVNGQPTIVPKKRGFFFNSPFGFLQTNTKPELGQRKGFSVGDVQKIRNMYGCDVK